MIYRHAYDIVKFDKVFSSFIPYGPIPKQSVRFGNGRGYIPKRIQQYADNMKAWWNSQYTGEVLNVPLKVELCFHLPFRVVDKYMEDNFECMLVRDSGDVDNLTKPIFDSMQGIVFHNDSQVCFLQCCKIRHKLKGTSVCIYTALQRFEQLSGKTSKELKK